jgi:hypothetical protein
MIKIITLVLFIQSMFFEGIAIAAEPGRTVLAADLKQEPFTDAATVNSLAANTDLKIIKRQGGWMQVKTPAGAQGWLKMTSIKLGSAGKDAKGGQGDSGVSSLAKLALTGRSGNTGVTATTGVRGLGQEDLKNAQPNPEAVKQLDKYLGSKNETRSFASAGKLQTQTVEYLDPAKSVASNSKGGR